jgi:hypothetical protein
MPDVIFNHRLSQPGDDGDAGTVETVLLESVISEPLVPAFGGVQRQNTGSLSLGLLELLAKRNQFGMKGGDVYAIALSEKADGGRLTFKIDHVEGNGGFRQTTALAHGDLPAYSHPFWNRGCNQRFFDFLLIFQADRVLLLGTFTLEAKANTWIGNYVATLDRFIQQEAKEFHFQKRGIPFGFPYADASGKSDSPKGVILGNFLRNLSRCYNSSVFKIDGESGPALAVTLVGLWFPLAVSLFKKAGNPFAECVAGDGGAKVCLVGGFEMCLPQRLPLPRDTVYADAGASVGPIALPDAKSEPVIGAFFAGVDSQNEDGSAACAATVVALLLLFLFLFDSVASAKPASHGWCARDSDAGG